MPVNPDSLSDDALLEVLDERKGPALPLSERETEALLQAALDRALPARAAPFFRRRSFALLLAAALFMTGISAALVLKRSGSIGSRPSALAPQPSSGQKLEVRPSSSAVPKAVPERAPVGDAPEEKSSMGAEHASSAHANTLDLLKAANQLRRQGRWADAERAYAQIPSPVAALAAASLRLEHLNDPRGALRLYQSALRASSLSAEAELGIADCYRALGDRAAEIAALRRLTSAHPDALFHERALRRLQALEAGKP